MVSNMIQISTDEGDIVFDPFAGSGTVMSQSAYMNRSYLGFELNKGYIDKFNSYMAETLEKGKSDYETMLMGRGQKDFEDQIINLRALKYGRMLVKTIQDELKIRTKVVVDRISQEGTQNMVHYTIVGIKKETADDVINNAISKAPLSKYEISPLISYQDELDVDKQWFCYSITNSYSFMRNVAYSDPCVRVLSPIKVDLNEKDYE